MAEKDPKDPHPGMMGDGTEEEVDEAFTKDPKLVPKE